MSIVDLELQQYILHAYEMRQIREKILEILQPVMKYPRHKRYSFTKWVISRMSSIFQFIDVVEEKIDGMLQECNLYTGISSRGLHRI